MRGIDVVGRLVDEKHPRRYDATDGIELGDNSDSDLVVAFARGPKTYVVLLEAKGFTSYGRKQLEHKCARLKTIFGESGTRFGDVVPHWVFVSPQAPPALKSPARWMLDADTGLLRRLISALWASMLFVFAYVDLFSLYRADFRADLETGKIAGFTINQSFLLGTTVYVVIPSLMVFLALVLRPRVGRITNIALPILYALTIVVGAIGEWNYYILGNTVEIALLAAIVYSAWTWPKETPITSTTR